MKKLTKINSFLDIEKEVNYINEMNKKGWKLEYAQLGCIFRFTQSEPDEYFTAFHATSKSQVHQMTSAAVMSGYECIPHTLDYMGNILLLTGKKGKVDENFISDNINRRNHCKELNKFYGTAALVCLFTALIAAIGLIWCTPTVIKVINLWDLYCERHANMFIALLVGVAMVLSGFITLSIYTAIFSRLFFKTKKQQDALDLDMRLYE